MRILLVDDRLDSSAILADWLGEFFGAVSLESAASSAEALSAMPGTRPELVLATHRIPVLNGIALARVIKAGANPPAVIVIGTGSDGDFELQCAAAGADFWLEERELQARLLAFLQQRFARVWAEGVRERERSARRVPATLAARARGAERRVAKRRLA
jgi:CheY-like chemotaxis protein